MTEVPPMTNQDRPSVLPQQLPWGWEQTGAGGAKPEIKTRGSAGRLAGFVTVMYTVLKRETNMNTNIF